MTRVLLVGLLLLGTVAIAQEPVIKAGNYVLRAYAEDASIHTPHDVSVLVRPAR